MKTVSLLSFRWNFDNVLLVGQLLAKRAGVGDEGINGAEIEVFFSNRTNHFFCRRISCIFKLKRYILKKGVFSDFWIYLLNKFMQRCSENAILRNDLQ